MRKDMKVDAHCIDVHEIGVVLELPADDPRRRHAAACPRCRSLLASYTSFIDAEPADGADLEHALGMLEASVRADAARWRPSRSPVRAFWWQQLLRPVPLLAAGLVVIAAAVFWSTREPEPGALRESTPESGSFSLSAAHVAPDGSIQLSWSALKGADQYQVRIYGPDFGEIYRSPIGSETALVVARTALPADLPPGLDLTWRVFALAEGDVIATSAPGSIRTP